MFLLLLVIWFGFNGAVTLEIFLFGLVICSAMIFFSIKFMGYNLKIEMAFIRMAPKLLGFVGTFIIELCKANLYVARVILSKKAEVRPVMVDFIPEVKHTFFLVLLANEITLTPGTITYRLEHGELCIHCLDRSLAEGIEESSLVKKIMDMEARYDV